MLAEQKIYFQQAVTMLTAAGRTAEGKERWLDWVLAQLLHPNTDCQALGSSIRRDLFNILSAAFLDEIPRVSTAKSVDGCFDHLFAYLVKGRLLNNRLLSCITVYMVRHRWLLHLTPFDLLLLVEDIAS